MINAVIPSDYEDDIKTCCLVGGMSIQKQKRLLSYKPSIIIATPGRLWELMDEHQDAYLANGLPLIDVLVMDEADRMVADGHFKELKFILNHIYQKRVKQKLARKKGSKVSTETEEVKSKIEGSKSAMDNFKVGKNLENNNKLAGIDESKIVDLDGEGEDDIFDEEIIVDKEK